MDLLGNKDYIILDEGHKIKNTTKTSKSIHLVPARNRIILTGTPVQNNLKEMWSLFDYVHQGSLLGTLRTFKMEFETPIIRARERDSTAVEKKLGQEMSEILKKIIKPYFLRRTKAEVQRSRKDSLQDDSKSLQMPSLTRKNDLVIWLKLTETQQKIYQDFLALDTVKELLMTKKSPLVALTVLKKICDHPRLLSTRACMQLGLDGEDFDEEILESAGSYESAVSQINNIPDDVLINESGKMIILTELLKTFKEEGHKTLIFSQSRKILDIIQKILYSLGHKVLRLDGTITNLMARDELVQKFQKDPSYSVFLLTIQVGGVGLTITAADRVVIYDPSWNPATDAQAVDRAYRIGQQKNVVIYRLITCGTVEEKIYRRQVFKDSITRQTTGNTKNPYRYFTKMELKELFTLDDPNFSKTQQQLQELHSHQRLTDETLDEHIAYLYSLDIFGISDHDLMYKQSDVHDKEGDEDDDELLSGETAERDVGFIQHKIQKAQMLIAEESTVPSTYEERSKGMMKYPSGSAAAGGTYRPTNYFQPPQTSALFTQVSSGSESEPINISNNSTDDLADEIQNISVSQDERVSKDKFKKEMISPSKNQSSPSGASRRPLQPLTSDEVRKRSPLIANKPGKVLEEELVFSPDRNSPIVKLESSGIRQKMSPMKLFGSPVKERLSPKKKENKSANYTHPELATDGSPARCSTPKSSKDFIPKKILTDSPLAKTGPCSPNLSPKKNILVEASPVSPLFESSSRAESSMISSTPSSDTSSTCRRLFVEETPDISRKESCQNDLRLMEHSGAALEDLRSQSNTSSKTGINKRRSVCLQQPAVVSSSDESEEDLNNSSAGNEENDGDNRQNVSGMNEEDDDDKENDPVMFRRAGKRNIIVSDSESEPGSCYEISDNDENKEDILSAENYGTSQTEVSMDQCLEDQDVEDKEMEDEEEEEEELNPVFLQLVQEARSLYKKKDYVGSLQHVEKALEIQQPPELQDMADKIRALISLEKC
ncbi:DNA excision repair protein ERCC-6-like [Bulinus truncatus]|nr:DNA excision repair protein ERCC-6-like [Bulinus truncatus]